MADIYSSTFRRAPSPTADGLYVPTLLMNDTYRRTPSPKMAYFDRRSGQHVRRSSLEPVLEGEVRVLDNRRHSVGPDVGISQSKPNLAKPRVPSSARTSQHNSMCYRSDSLLRSESLLSVEVKTNVVITNEYLFMNELTYHLSIRYSRPISSIVVSLQHGMCLLFGGSFDPAYIMTITALHDQVSAGTNKRNVVLFQAHLQQALRVPPSRGLVQFIPITEECLGHGGEMLAAAAGGSYGRQGSHINDDGRNGDWRRTKSLALRRPSSLISMASRHDDKMESPVVCNTTIPIQKKAVDTSTSPETKPIEKRKGFMNSLFIRSQKDIGTK